MKQRALQDQLSDIHEECRLAMITERNTLSFVLFMTNSIVFALIFSRLREACSLAEERVGERELAEGFPYLNRVCVMN